MMAKCGRMVMCLRMAECGRIDKFLMMAECERISVWGRMAEFRVWEDGQLWEDDTVRVEGQA